MGVVQRVEGNSREIYLTTKVINETEIYLRDVISKPQYDNIRYLCKNQHGLCAFWASEGFCQKNNEYMKQHCPLACQSCEEIGNNTVSIDEYNIGVRQELGDDDNRMHQIQKVISISNQYYLEEIVANPDNADIRDMCINKHELCSYWATLDQCKFKYGFMDLNCPLACQSCERIRDQTRIEQYDIGVNQKVDGNEMELQRTGEVIRLSHQYYLEEIVANPDNADIRDMCINKHELCSFWAAFDQCEIKYGFMDLNCPLACQSCERIRDQTRIEQYDIGVNQKVEGHKTEIQRTEEVIRLSHQYYLEEIVANPDNADIRDMCINKHELCSFWAAAGECTVHDVFMQSNCSLACQLCEKFKDKDNASKINSDYRIERTVSSSFSLNPMYPPQSPTQNRIHSIYPQKKAKV